MTTREVVLDGGAPWGFRLHGGADTSQPLRIARVNPGSKAALRAIREGDFITSINGRPTKDLSNAEAHALLRNSGDTLRLGLNEDGSGSPKRRQYKTVHQETHSETVKKSSVTQYTVTSSKTVTATTPNDQSTSKVNGDSTDQSKNPIASKEPALSTCSSTSSTPSTYTSLTSPLGFEMADVGRSRRRRSRRKSKQNEKIEEEYQVESPKRAKSPQGKKPVKSKSLDDDDVLKIQELSEVSETEEKCANAIISEAESEPKEADVEWESLDVMAEPELTKSTTLTLTIVPLEEYTAEQVSLISPEEELTLRNFLEGLNLVNSPEDAFRQVREISTMESVKSRRARKRAAIEQYFSPMVQNPRFLDVISEEASDVSDRETSLTHHLKQGTPEPELPPKVPPRRRRVIENPMFLVGTKIIEVPKVAHVLPSSKAEVVFLEDNSSSNSSTPDPRSEDEEKDTTNEDFVSSCNSSVPDLRECESVEETKQFRFSVKKNDVLIGSTLLEEREDICSFDGSNLCQRDAQFDNINVISREECAKPGEESEAQIHTENKFNNEEDNRNKTKEIVREENNNNFGEKTNLIEEQSTSEVLSKMIKLDDLTPPIVINSDAAGRTKTYLDPEEKKISLKKCSCKSTPIYANVNPIGSLVRFERDQEVITLESPFREEKTETKEQKTRYIPIDLEENQAKDNQKIEEAVTVKKDNQENAIEEEKSESKTEERKTGTKYIRIHLEANKPQEEVPNTRYVPIQIEPGNETKEKREEANARYIPIHLEENAATSRNMETTTKEEKSLNTKTEEEKIKCVPIQSEENLNEENTTYTRYIPIKVETTTEKETKTEEQKNSLEEKEDGRYIPIKIEEDGKQRTEVKTIEEEKQKTKIISVHLEGSSKQTEKDERKEASNRAKSEKQEVTYIPIEIEEDGKERTVDEEKQETKIISVHLEGNSKRFEKEEMKKASGTTKCEEKSEKEEVRYIPIKIEEIEKESTKVKATIEEENQETKKMSVHSEGNSKQIEKEEMKDASSTTKDKKKEVRYIPIKIEEIEKESTKVKATIEEENRKTKKMFVHSEGKNKQIEKEERKEASSRAKSEKEEVRYIPINIEDDGKEKTEVKAKIEEEKQQTKNISVRLEGNSKQIEREERKEASGRGKDDTHARKKSEKEEVRYIPIKIEEDKKENTKVKATIEEEKQKTKNICASSEGSSKETEKKERKEASNRAKSEKEEVRYIPINIEDGKGNTEVKATIEEEKQKTKNISVRLEGNSQQIEKEEKKEASGRAKDDTHTRKKSEKEEVRYIPIKIEEDKKESTKVKATIEEEKQKTKNICAPSEGSSKETEKKERKEVRYIPINIEDGKGNTEVKAMIEEEKQETKNISVRLEGNSKQIEKEERKEASSRTKDETYTRYIPIKLEETRKVETKIEKGKSLQDDKAYTRYVPIKVESEEEDSNNTRYIPIEMEEDGKERTKTTTTMDEKNQKIRNIPIHLEEDSDSRREANNTRYTPIRKECEKKTTLIPIKLEVSSDSKTLDSPSKEVESLCKNLKPPDSVFYSNVLSPPAPPSPSPSLSSGSSSRATSLCTTKFNSMSDSIADIASIKDDANKFPSLREICVSFLMALPFGADILQELADVSSSIQHLTDRLLTKDQKDIFRGVAHQDAVAEIEPRLLAIIRDAQEAGEKSFSTRNMSVDGARLRARNLNEWLKLARNKSRSELNLNENSRREGNAQQRRNSLPHEFYERQMIYLQEKEREIQRELEMLEDEKRKLAVEMMVAPRFREEDFRISKRGDFAENKKPRPVSMPEFFRQQMYEEYLDQMAAREERKQLRVIKVSQIDSQTLGKTTTDIRDEFMDKVKEKQKLGKLNLEEGKSDVEEGEKVPKHLQELMDIATTASQDGVWSPGQKSEPIRSDIRNQVVDAKNEAVSPVWTPKSANSSPTAERKEFRPVKFESPVLGRKSYRSEDEGSCTEPPWKVPDTSSDTGIILSSALEKRLPTSHSSPASGFNDFPTTRLPRAQNPTITLLQKAREGQLPKGALYIEQEQTFKPSNARPPLVGPGEILYKIKNEYTSESDSEKPRKMAELGPRKYEGIGPMTRDGMPLILRSEVKDANQSKWYKKMYDTIHKQKPHRDEFVTVRYKQKRGQYPYTSGYLSEPEPGAYDSDFADYKYATLDRRRLTRDRENDYVVSSTMPRAAPISEKVGSSIIKHGHDPYKNQPGRIENYIPGHSSISEKEAKEWWDEVMDIFDGHLEQQKRVPQTKSFINQALKESGYESDSTLVFRRRDDTAQQLSPSEQKEAYKIIQKGGDIPLHGLRKPAPERPKEPEPPIPPPKGQHGIRNLLQESPRKYVENEVTIHYKTPVRQEIKEYLSEDELAYRQAEAMKKIYQEERRRKYLQVSKSLDDELQDMNSRRHTDNFIPSQKSPISLNRYDELDDLAPPVKPRPRSPEPRLVARALYNFVGQTARELTFRKSDLIYVRRQVDKNWYEGELNAMVGLFPANYVEIVTYDTAKPTHRKSHEGQARAKFNFVAQTHLELSLAKGELVIITRRVDDNWFEGKIGGRKGIFPVSYVEVLIDPSDPPSSKPGNPPSKPVASPAAHSLLLNGSSGGKESMGSHSYTPTLSSNQLTGSYHAKPVQTTGSYASLNRGKNPVGQALHIETQSEPVPYRALYKYLPQNDDELELLEGDTVFVLEKCDDGWYVGSSERTGAFGTFPGNYVEKI